MRVGKPKEDEELGEIRKRFKQISVNVPLLDLISKILAYRKVLKEYYGKRRKKRVPKCVCLTKVSSVCCSQTLLKKCKDPGTPHLTCKIGDLEVSIMLLNLGAGVNIMPRYLCDRLGLREFKPTRTIIKLVDKFVRVPLSMLEDVLVRVGEFVYPTDFIVSEMH
jgi:hypothetical protein